MPKGHRSALATTPIGHAPISTRPDLHNSYYDTSVPLTRSNSLQSFEFHNDGSVQMPMSTPQYSLMAQGPPLSSIRPSSGAWKPEDDQTLIAARAQGMHWAPIQQAYFPSKTPNACRKRHERLMERRSAGDRDRMKLETLAKNYMGMRREIWQGLAAQTGEKWNVSEQKCMSQGLKNLQTAARSCARRERMLETSQGESNGGAYGERDDSGIGLGDDIEADYTHGQRLPSMDMGIDYIINKPGRSLTTNDVYPSNCLDHSSATASSTLSNIKTTGNLSDNVTRTPSPYGTTSESKAPISVASNNEFIVSADHSHPSHFSPPNAPSSTGGGERHLPTTSGPLKELISASAAPEKEDTTMVHVDTLNVLQISIDEPHISGGLADPQSPYQESQASYRGDLDAFQESQESNDDCQSLVSWEDQTIFGDGIVLPPTTRKRFDTVISLSTALRYRLLSQLMLEFHLRSKQSLTAADPCRNSETPPTERTTTNTTPSNTASGNSSTPSESSTASNNFGNIISPSNTRQIVQKRDTGEDNEEDEEKNKKRPRRDPPGSPLTSAKRGKFTCPYRHREPRSFGLSTNDVCASKWPDIAKLKEHLYRKHFHRFQCQRCKANIRSRFELDLHAENSRPCQPRTRRLTDGFTFETYEMLHNKKKSFQGQNDENRWQEIYELLFFSEESIASHSKPYINDSSNLRRRAISANSLEAFDSKNSNNPSPRAETMPNSGYGDLNLFENYNPYAEALVTTRMGPIEAHLLGQVLSPTYQSEDRKTKNPQDLPIPSIQEQDFVENRSQSLSAVSELGSRYVGFLSSDNLQSINDTCMIDFQTSCTGHTDYDSQLNASFSQYASLPLQPAQLSSNQDVSLNENLDFCSKCNGHCLCIDFEVLAPSRPFGKNIQPATPNNTNIIQELLERIEALEKKQ